MIALAIVAFVLLLWVSLLYVPFHWRPLGLYLFIEKVLALAYAPFLVAIGAALALAGALLGSWWTAVPAALASAGALVVILRIGAAGAWWTGPLPSTPEPRVRRDVAFATIPTSDRVLRCNVWQPPTTIAPSGVAIVYLFGSAYMILDKDFGTRPLFRQLTAHGHVVIDVAYRLFPETDVVGMVGDAKRAIAWTRANASELAIDPDRIVVAGGSAGGHLALLAAYGHDDPALTPPDLVGTDVHVAGVVSLYGQVGLDSLYRHTSQARVCHRDDPQPDWHAPPSRTLIRMFHDDAARLKLQLMPYAGRCDWLVGGVPDEVPDRYARVSALHYVRADNPPTLLVHGTHDEMAPVEAVHHLQHDLEAVGAPVTAIYLPHTDHAFDVIGTTWSPPARVSLHALERFLARGAPHA